MTTPEDARAEALTPLQRAVLLVDEVLAVARNTKANAFDWNDLHERVAAALARAAQGAPPPLKKWSRALFAYRARAYQYSPETPTDLDDKYADVLEAALTPSSSASGGEAQ